MSHRPTSDLVAVAWCRGVAGIPPGAVATTLPKPGADGVIRWADTGFIQVGPVVGGSMGLEMATRAPVLQISCWATNQGSSKPPWGKASQLAQLIVDGTYAGQQYGKRDVSAHLPDSYAGARVMTALATEPRRFPGDPGSYARYLLELTLNWTDKEGS
ncbi:hypothetical protein [Rhizomonospora bruguierae]|uniref:hypothetical protein n=1 Tax=Rhizomonospora bruguierae TaxID=1581705 RepID=UPI001BCB855F|nr:hypothetical protein [Micromonospora sp. NBRC 107566]